MIFNEHSNLKGLHSFLSPSQPSWLNYDDDKLIFRYNTWKAAERGTKLHELAQTCIELNQKLEKKQKTLNMYVNDAIGFKMIPEQPLYFSSNCFGTADAISFRQNLLRIHDLKTGTTPAHMEQLLTYAALFCLEYKHKPGNIIFELRIYQNDQITIFTPTAEDVLPVMDKIIRFDKLLNKVKEKE